MPLASITETLSVSRDQLFATIVDYESYPEFVDGCSSVEVVSRESNRARITYHVNFMKEISYTLDLEESRETGDVRWTLASSDFMKQNAGHWKLSDASGGKTHVEYSVDIDFKFPVPGFILKNLIKTGLPSMLRNFEKQARKSKT